MKILTNHVLVTDIQHSDGSEGVEGGEAAYTTRAAVGHRGPAHHHHAPDEGQDQPHGGERRTQGTYVTSTDKSRSFNFYNSDTQIKFVLVHNATVYLQRLPNDAARKYELN